MPVRDALQLLEREGLVETSARRWTRVVDLEPALVVELVPIVALLEQHALAIAPMPSPEATASLRAANDRFASSIERADVAGVIAADAEFHAGIIALAANRSLERAIRDAGTRLRLLRARVVRPELARASIEDHDRIVDRLEHGDRAGAVRAVGDNWERGLARFRHEGVRLSRLRM
jgi:DNA-binding GntR family transcriptional regulator